MLLRCISRHSATFSPLILILLWNVVSQEKMLRNNAVYESSVRRHDLGYESPNPADTQHKYHTNAKVSSQHLHRSFFFDFLFDSVIFCDIFTTLGSQLLLPTRLLFNKTTTCPAWPNSGVMERSPGSGSPVTPMRSFRTGRSYLAEMCSARVLPRVFFSLGRCLVFFFGSVDVRCCSWL